MTFFANFPEVLYKFGNESTLSSFENLSAYVDVIDNLKDESTFYTKYTILDGDRPDILSQKLYESSNYYWTFYLMNDHIRRQGWPLSYNDLLQKAQKDYPHTTITMSDSIFNKFNVGDNVTGSTSGATGTVLRRNLNLSQIIVKSTNSKQFSDGEIMSDGNNTMTNLQVVDEYLSTHHYINSSGEYVDPDPADMNTTLTNVSGGQVIPITYLDRYVENNETLKEIKIVRPNRIIQIVQLFEEALAGPAENY